MKKTKGLTEEVAKREATNQGGWWYPEEEARSYHSYPDLTSDQWIIRSISQDTTPRPSIQHKWSVVGTLYPYQQHNHIANKVAFQNVFLSKPQTKILVGEIVVYVAYLSFYNPDILKIKQALLFNNFNPRFLSALYRCAWSLKSTSMGPLLLKHVGVSSFFIFTLLSRDLVWYSQ